MPSLIDPETMYVDDLPAIWSPVQWELSAEERIQALEEQATASLLWCMDAPQAVLRLLLEETGIQRLFAAPAGYDPHQQGEWDSALITFGPERAIQLEAEKRTPQQLELIYDCGTLGHWEIIIQAEKVTIERI